MILRQTVATVIAMVVIPVLMGVVVLTYWSADRDPPVLVRRMWAEPDTVKPCGNIRLWVNRTALKSTGVHVERMLKDQEEREPLPPIDWRENPGGLGDLSYSLGEQVPCTFRPGWATYRSQIYYYRNPIHEYLWPIPAEPNVVRFCVFTDDVPPEQACKKDGSPDQ